MRFISFAILLSMAVSSCVNRAFAVPMPHKTEFELKVNENVSVTVKIQAASFEQMNATREILVDKLSRPKECLKSEIAPAIENTTQATGYQKSSFHWQWEQ